LKVTPNVQLHYSLGVLYEKTDRLKAAIKEMEHVLKLDPQNADAMNFIGYSYADRGIMLQEAEELIKKALSLKPGNGYMLDSLGWVYFRQEKITEAIKYLKEAIAVLPDDPTITEHLGDAYVKSGRHEEARETYEKVLKLNPNNQAVREKIEKLPLP